MKLNIIDIVNLSVKSITEKTYNDFLKEVRVIGMEEKKDMMNGFHPYTPKYDKLNVFDYYTDKNEHINLDIFGAEKIILEINIIIGIGLPRLSFMSPGKRIYKEIIESFKKIYGDGYSIMYEKRNRTFENSEIKIDIIYSGNRRHKMDIVTVSIRNNKLKTELEDLLSKMKP
ncbi:MAG: hypothetical protein ACLP7A_11940 [Desulfobaccales bacterium]